MFALRAVRGPLRSPTLEPRQPPRRSLRAPRVRARSSDHLAPLPRRSSDAPSASRPGTSGSSGSSFRELDGTTLVLDAPDDVRALGRDAASRRLLQRLRRDGPRPGGARARSAARRSREPPARARGATRAGAAQDLNPRLTFDQFVIGDCNRLAHAAALAVAEMPGAGLQPAVHLRAARASARRTCCTRSPTTSPSTAAA